MRYLFTASLARAARDRSAARVAHRPALGDAVDAALVVRDRAQRIAVVIEGAAVPVAVPRLALQRGLQRIGRLAPFGGVLAGVVLLGQQGEGLQRGIGDPAQPHALALAAF